MKFCLHFCLTVQNSLQFDEFFFTTSKTEFLGFFGIFVQCEIFFNVYEILFDIFESNEISQDMCEASVATLMRSRIGVIDEINGDPSSCLAKGDPSSERYVP